MANEFERGGLDEQIERLEDTLGGTGALVARFDTELARLAASMKTADTSVGKLSTSVSRGLRSAFDGLVFDGIKLSDALKSVGASIVNATYSAALGPVSKHLGGLVGAGLAGIGASAFAQGASFSQGRVMPFAKGGVVSSPSTFPMRGGTGLMGEAGPEAILPLQRGADGSLGVRGGGTGSVNVVMHISTPDVQGFQRSQSQIAAQVGRALSRGQRNR